MKTANFPPSHDLAGESDKNSTKRNVVIADCSIEEIQTFADGIAETIGEPVEIITSFKKKYSTKSLWGKIKYYTTFFTFSFKIWRRRKEFKLVLGWQQFYALNFGFYSRLFGSKNKDLTSVAVNYTYKQKPGIIGKLYASYMRYCTNAVNFLHVLSFGYAKRINQELGFPIDKILVTHFGTPDFAEKWEKLPNPETEPYVLSIGRSNRDFDFLVDIWSQPQLADHRLIILADLWKPSHPLPPNVTHYDNVLGEKSFAYIANAELSVVPVDDPLICSGDTVLLNSMMMKVPVAVTNPSTLSDMYITDGYDGIYIERDAAAAAEKIASVLNNERRKKELGEAARQSYLQRFSRYTMGKELGEQLLKHNFKTEDKS